VCGGVARAAAKAPARDAKDHHLAVASRAVERLWATNRDSGGGSITSGNRQSVATSVL
jgi:hypothetical protein